MELIVTQMRSARLGLELKIRLRDENVSPGTTETPSDVTNSLYVYIGMLSSSSIKKNWNEKLRFLFYYHQGTVVYLLKNILGMMPINWIDP